MTFITRYKTEFADHFGNEWQVLIAAEDFGATQVSLKAAGNPVTISYNGDVTNKNQVIFPLSAEIRVLTDTPYQLHDLLYSGDRKWKVTIFKNALGISDDYVFQGWVLPFSSNEPRTSNPEQFVIRCSDGLTDLANFQYLDDDGNLYDEWQTLSTVITNCLAKTGLTLNWWENIDLYPDNTQGNADSVFDKVLIHTKSYGERVDEVLDCLSILRRELLPFNARIYQRGRDTDQDIVWWIEKTKLKEDSTSPRFRKFNSSGVYQSNATETHELAIKADVKIQGGNTIKRPLAPLGELVIKSNRGLGFSLLEGANFEDGDFPTSTTVNNWGAMAANTNHATWGTMTFTSGSIYGEKYLEPDAYSADHVNIGGVSVEDSAGTPGTARFTTTGLHSLTTSDHVALWFPNRAYYCTMGKVTAVRGGGTPDWFELSIAYVDDVTGDDRGDFWTINNASALQQTIPLGDALDTIVDGDYVFTVTVRIASSNPSGVGNQPPLCLILEANNSSTDYLTAFPAVQVQKIPTKVETKVIQLYDLKKSDRRRGLARLTQPIGLQKFLPEKQFYSKTNTQYDTKQISENFEWSEDIWGYVVGRKEIADSEFTEFEFSVTLNSDNGFFTSGTPEVYLSFFDYPSNAFTGVDLYISEIRCSLTQGMEDSLTSTVSSNSIDPLTIELDRYDAPGNDNDEFVYLNPYRILSGGVHVMEETWYEAGADVKNIEDHFQDNVEEIYADTSLVLEGTGQIINDQNRIDLYRTMRDSVDFNRLWYFGRLAHDIKYRAIRFTAIEMIPYGNIYPDDPGFDTGDGWTGSDWTISGGSASTSFAATGVTSNELYWGDLDKLGYNSSTNTTWKLTLSVTLSSGLPVLQPRYYNGSAWATIGTGIVLSAGTSTYEKEITFTAETVNAIGLRAENMQSGVTIDINSMKVEFVSY